MVLNHAHQQRMFVFIILFWGFPCSKHKNLELHTVITLRKPTQAGCFQSLRETYFFSHQGVEQGTAWFIVKFVTAYMTSQLWRR